MKLGLFFSRGVSLQLWLDKGLYDREKLLYEKHLEDKFFSKVHWFTYGSEDTRIATMLKKENRLHKSIEVHSMPKIFNIPKIGTYFYSLFLPFIQKRYLVECDVYKTNQTDGSWSAVIAKKFYNKKLVYRTGFTMSQLENKLKRFNCVVLKSIEFFEKLAYKNCNKAVVASKHNLVYIKNKYELKNNKIEIIYNFIDRNKFYDYKRQRENKIIYIGRLSDEKNIFNLIVASHKVNLFLDIYGSGPLETELKTFALDNNYSKVVFKGNVANTKLPDILNNSKYYALVSKHEGMPKALIEAMACGNICIGTDVSGINEVIVPGSGILAQNISVYEIEKAFNKAIILSNNDIIKIKDKSIVNIDSNFTLDSIVKKEKILFKELIDG